MHMLYNSDNYAVVQIDVMAEQAASGSDESALTRGGYEIVDKFARKELFIEGALAEQFKEGVDALIESSPSVEEFDAYLEMYAGLAHHPVVMH
jgi:oligoendopeptidase F